MEITLKTDAIWGAPKSNTNWFGNTFPFLKSNRTVLSTPKIIQEKCQGIKLGIHQVRSLIFTTDIALIEHSDTDAILAVYPFPPSLKIMKGLIEFSSKPVICGIGGGLTKGKIAIDMALQAQQLEAAAVIVNQPFKNRDIELVKKNISIPLISSISDPTIGLAERINAGADIIHITGGKNTGLHLEKAQSIIPGTPLLATGGKTIQNLQTVIASGAHGIVLTPPSTGELFFPIMEEYRKGIKFWQKIMKF